jgi:hypothetical protein
MDLVITIKFVRPIIILKTYNLEGFMEFARNDSEYYCGVDLDARFMFIGIMKKLDNIFLYGNIQNFEDLSRETGDR